MTYTNQFVDNSDSAYFRRFWDEYVHTDYELVLEPFYTIYTLTYNFEDDNINYFNLAFSDEYVEIDLTNKLYTVNFTYDYFLEIEDNVLIIDNSKGTDTYAELYLAKNFIQSYIDSTFSNYVFYNFYNYFHGMNINDYSYSLTEFVPVSELLNIGEELYNQYNSTVEHQYQELDIDPLTFKLVATLPHKSLANPRTVYITQHPKLNKATIYDKDLDRYVELKGDERYNDKEINEKYNETFEVNEIFKEYYSTIKTTFDYYLERYNSFNYWIIDILENDDKYMLSELSIKDNVYKTFDILKLDLNGKKGFKGDKGIDVHNYTMYERNNTIYFNYYLDDRFITLSASLYNPILLDSSLINLEVNNTSIIETLENNAILFADIQLIGEDGDKGEDGEVVYNLTMTSCGFSYWVDTEQINVQLRNMCSTDIIELGNTDRYTIRVKLSEQDFIDYYIGYQKLNDYHIERDGNNINLIQSFDTSTTVNQPIKLGEVNNVCPTRTLIDIANGTMDVVYSDNYRSRIEFEPLIEQHIDSYTYEFIDNVLYQYKNGTIDKHWSIDNYRPSLLEDFIYDSNTKTFYSIINNERVPIYTIKDYIGQQIELNKGKDVLYQLLLDVNKATLTQYKEFENNSYDFIYPQFENIIVDKIAIEQLQNNNYGFIVSYSNNTSFESSLIEIDKLHGDDYSYEYENNILTETIYSHDNLSTQTNTFDLSDLAIREIGNPLEITLSENIVTLNQGDNTIEVDLSILYQEFDDTLYDNLLYSKFGNLSDDNRIITVNDKGLYTFNDINIGLGIAIVQNNEQYELSEEEESVESPINILNLGKYIKYIPNSNIKPIGINKMVG